MENHEFSEHARDMLKERNIEESWVEQVVTDPDRREEKKDGTVASSGRLRFVGGVTFGLSSIQPQSRQG